jgi:hypothetical protein
MALLAETAILAELAHLVPLANAQPTAAELHQVLDSVQGSESDKHFRTAFLG